MFIMQRFELIFQNTLNVALFIFVDDKGGAVWSCYAWWCVANIHVEICNDLNSAGIQGSINMP